jgi:hypothetical protein
VIVERDRRAKLAAQSVVNGIDFVEVVPDTGETRLRVHFVNRTPDKTALAAAVTGATITGGETIPEVAATLDGWDSEAGRPVLKIAVKAPGDFSTYTLRLLHDLAASPVLDRFFDHVTFSFKADCPSTLDCESPAPDCPPPESTAPPIDYLAKDFRSFRKALSDFSVLRYPAWQERSEADFGVMFMEALASVADDLSYQQDRVAAEGWLETATQRRSLVRLARLVDYEPRVATASRVWLAFEMAAGATDPIPAGLAVSAQAPDGTPIDFETGTGLDDKGSYSARPEWNAIEPYWWDEQERCLPVGATEMLIEDPGPGLAVDQLLLIDTSAAAEADAPLREIVKLTAVDDPITDPLYGVTVVRVAWRDEDKLQAAHDLGRTRVRGNLVPATQGRRTTDTFVTSRTGPAPAGGLPRAVVRTGPNGTVQFLHTLRQAPLAWLQPESPTEAPAPELRVSEASNGRRDWSFVRSLLDATVEKEVVTVEPARYRVIDAAAGMAEYDGSDGDTLRFGDGVFGAIPRDRAVFEVTYRWGGGTGGNVAADAINVIDARHPIAAQIAAVTNPLPADGGRDQEGDDKIRDMAPQKFRAKPLRAVRPEDYEQAAESLAWVQRAGTTFRYTGSWLTVFTAVDPKGSEALAPDLTADLTDLLNRRRMAGYESYVLPPRYASLDLSVTVCARPDAFRGDVKRAVLAALDTRAHADGTLGFFHPDRFTFGVGLERSAVEAAVQGAAGVDGVLDVSYRRRGRTAGFVPMPDLVLVADDEIVRVDNDPGRPERGSLRVDVAGGK